MVHTVRGIIDLEGPGIASGPMTARPESSTALKCTATLLINRRSASPRIVACFHVRAL
jgi:hypothetical protein